VTVFGEGAEDTVLAARVAALEQELATLTQSVAANATAAQQALQAEATARAQGDQVNDQAVITERTARVSGDQANADAIGDIYLRLAAGGGGGDGGAPYVPSFDFSDPRNTAAGFILLFEDF
jgi:hypothetical protein